MIYEIAVLFSLILTVFLLGVFVAILVEMKRAKTALVDKVKEFDKITSKVSDANNSMGLMLSDLGDRIQIIDERVSMLSGNQQTGGPKWPSSRSSSS